MSNRTMIRKPKDFQPKADEEIRSKELDGSAIRASWRGDHLLVHWIKGGNILCGLLMNEEGVVKLHRELTVALETMAKIKEQKEKTLLERKEKKLRNKS